MNSIVKPYLLRASLLAALSILMGLALSFLVYNSSEKVRYNAIELVNNRIPVLISVNQIVADLSEQERIIYEYYRSENDVLFLEKFNKNKASFNMHVQSISQQMTLVEATKLITIKENEIELLAMKFHQAMNLDEDNWGA
jgi:hypothetical protein